MWLRYHCDGSVLEYRMHPPGRHRSAASRFLPLDGHHGG